MLEKELADLSEFFSRPEESCITRYTTETGCSFIIDRTTQDLSTQEGVMLGGCDLLDLYATLQGIEVQTCLDGAIDMLRDELI